MKKLLITAVALLLLCAAAAGCFIYPLTARMPVYNRGIGAVTEQQKIRGCWLVEQSASLGDDVIIYGSSELNTEYISTHPANYFAGGSSGFTVNLVGRGSCQSIIHALNIIAQGDALRGKKVVLITSPQSYVADGIAPDMFVANFSQQQYLRIMLDGDVSKDFKSRFSLRVEQLLKKYDDKYGEAPGVDASRLMAGLYNGGSKTALAALSPYFKAESLKAELKDRYASAKLVNACGEERTAQKPPAADGEAEYAAAVEKAKAESSNNEFGMENGYYSTYIGRKLEQNKGKEASLSYSESVEYDDLKLLLDVCGAYGIKPLFISVPLNGKWCDYTGFTKERREEYYGNVASLVSEYDCELLDLTDREYEEYYLCDTMHLGWTGWLEVNHAIERYYQEND